jgi:hypothetical protein
VPFDSSSTTSGVFAANPHRPISNPYTQKDHCTRTKHT